VEKQTIISMWSVFASSACAFIIKSSQALQVY